MDWEKLVEVLFGAGKEYLSKETPEEQKKREDEERRANNIAFGVMIFAGLLFGGLLVILLVRKK